MNNKFRQAIFKLNLDEIIDLSHFLLINFCQKYCKTDFFKSYPQFLNFVYAIVAKQAFISSKFLNFVSRETKNTESNAQCF
ncbi:hypothetical protein A3E97_02805 [Candidatus Uhrbacteria bacterium RIFCSPHIGHO2_12_FULL_47_12]|uniref:DUF4372 domain-containing protein n=1 Tax=Candidatus Uhrbacteria bacterium RIFCSPLOWO2_02_FULL_48_18 TaxID=1802408 RepID=A0A1F7VCJ3_9BACT|nr:MAG: hypothetical protein A3E97_02805 [Candidatus Uhrbacteria bacterium RIFCSPHIGHO2_12_FULL_47_12]OGL80547.1 MAG: hypothetical protein A3B20_04055 [Candidatus Uhrbacteria bacterium RIFCSPLOWO2_01_FULL_47_17]OGL88270.1 MAG: hypothetical protein A3I41_00925 [Candidatus Uhrbacteria bacterium RIFCSPLOWO2_02_FULL_48_18]OGL93186.1 MAG: hypothetical protein A3H12_03155 [Candidatus Uhrbacteria bacterium RIFCSPLOWO2_12_FULL_47_9]